MAAAIPFALKAAPVIAGMFLGKKASKPSPLQRTATGQTQQAGERLAGMGEATTRTGGELTRTGTGFLSRGAEELAPAASYYRNVLGSRSAANAALAPERGTALEYYRGAEGRLRRTMRGPARESQLAELERQKVGQLASYLPQARQAGAAGLERTAGAYGGLGGQALGAGAGLTGQGIQAATAGGYLGSGLFNQASQLREQEKAGGKAWGNILYDVANLMPWGKRRPKVPNLFQGF